MARTVNQEEYLAKRNEILDIAQQLVQRKGYEEMSIQDILDALHISKGAFYHYFPSKPALLEALVERICEGVEQILCRVLALEGQSTLEKLNYFFAVIAQWKTREKELHLSLIRVHYTDENALMREKMRVAMTRQLGKRMDALLAQGVATGEFSPAYPDRVGELFMLLIQDMNDTVARQLLDSETENGSLKAIMKTYGAFGDVMERILGLAPGSLVIADEAMLNEWMTAGKVLGASSVESGV